MYRRATATTQPSMAAPTRKSRNRGTPTSKINAPPMANNAPAIPPDPGIFETLICGGDPLPMQHLLTISLAARRNARPLHTLGLGTRSDLLQGVGDAESELERVLLESGWR